MSEQGLPEGTTAVRFAQVARSAVKVPSWIAKPHPAPVSLRPARPPREFVAAVRQQLGASPSIPPDPGPPPSRASATAVQDAPVEPRRAESARPAGPVVDAETVAAFQAAVGELVQVRAALFEQSANQIAELAVLIAQRVIARELTLDPGLIVGLAREGLEALGAHDRVRVRLGQRFAGVVDELARSLDTAHGRVEISVEDELDEHACFVETEHGNVDESIDARLATLLQALTPDSERP